VQWIGLVTMVDLQGRLCVRYLIAAYRHCDMLLSTAAFVSDRHYIDI